MKLKHIKQEFDTPREQIIALFQCLPDGKTIDYGDITHTLDLDLELVVNICNELEKEGIIG